MYVYEMAMIMSSHVNVWSKCLGDFQEYWRWTVGFGLVVVLSDHVYGLLRYLEYISYK